MSHRSYVCRIYMLLHQFHPILVTARRTRARCIACSRVIFIPMVFNSGTLLRLSSTGYTRKHLTLGSMEIEVGEFLFEEDRSFVFESSKRASIVRLVSSSMVFPLHVIHESSQRPALNCVPFGHSERVYAERPPLAYTGHFSSFHAMSQNIHSYRELMIKDSSIR
jgi:hypothetical protein